MKTKDLMAKAVQAATSAKVLLDTGDADGACNRAYYALFDAARAALLKPITKTLAESLGER